MPSLPVLDLHGKVLASLKAGSNLIVRAPTGSGKSTQVPQMLLDSGLCEGQILILQPRRLAARMLAARVAEERASELGSEIGFQTRFETLVSRDTRVRFITEGILPRLLLTDRKLSAVSAVIFDEFHERSLANDLGLALVKDLQEKHRPDLRIIVMSATVDVAPVAAYLGNPAIVESAGRMFPIDIRYLTTPPSPKTPVWDLAADAARALIGQGAPGDILVFMPGAYEIRRTAEAIGERVRSESVVVLPLYGDLPADRQRRVMEQLTHRKIIVATNIAETSLTIPGVRHVIDCGLARVARFDPGRGFNTLFTEPVSADSADQRAGRAGREAAGTCVRLWTAAHHAGRARRTTPEVLRVDLGETVLYLRMLGYDSVNEFRWFEAPGEAPLDAAGRLLTLLGALNGAGNVTELGKDMADFPAHPRLARLLLEAGKRGAVRLATFAAALLSERPFLAGKPEYPEAAHRHEIASDFFGQFCLLEKISASGFDAGLCARFAVNGGAARAVLRAQALFLQHCRRKGLHTHDVQDAPAALALCLLLAYPDHLAARRDEGTLICNLRDGRRGELARDSLARSARLLVAADIREAKDAKHALRTVLTLATEIKEEWLREHFADAWSEESAVEWNSVAQAVDSSVRRRCLGVLIEEKTSTGANSPEVSSLLADTIVAKGLKLSGWDGAATDLINRVAWVAQQFPDASLPRFTDEDRSLAIHALCEGERRYDNVKDKPVLPYLQQLLSATQRDFVDAMAPQSIELPSGRRLRITYEPGRQPRARTRIQDLYGMRNTPRVAGNRVRVLMEILAPSNRPVQITDDLASFWSVHYPEIKKTLGRRYPKHEWR